MADTSGIANRDPSDVLTIGRTVLANDRTLLAFFRTSLTFGAAGIGLIKYLEHPVYEALGTVLLALAGFFLVWGAHRYRHVKRILKSATPEDAQAVEKEMGL